MLYRYLISYQISLIIPGRICLPTALPFSLLREELFRLMRKIKYDFR